MAKPRSAAQKAALRKAQLASARKRRGTGKAVPKKGGRAPAKKQSHLKKHGKKYLAAAAVAGTVAGSAYVYKNRERLIVVPAAERRFVKIHEKKKGRKLTKEEKDAVKKQERIDHANRSVDVVRKYLNVRKTAQAHRGKSLKPGSKNYFNDYFDKKYKGNPAEAARRKREYFEMYRKDVNARARHRLAKSKGRKVQGFNYNSGKQVKVTAKGKVVRKIW